MREGVQDLEGVLGLERGVLMFILILRMMVWHIRGNLRGKLLESMVRKMRQVKLEMICGSIKRVLMGGRRDDDDLV